MFKLKIKLNKITKFFNNIFYYIEGYTIFGFDF